MPRSIVLLAALAVAGCGSDAPEKPRHPAPVTSAKPSPPPDAVGPYRFVRPPLVLRYDRYGSPDYLVLLHLNRRLPSGPHSAEIALNDVVSNDEGRGHDDMWGYDSEFAAPPCYTKWIFPGRDSPTPLDGVRPGQRVVVRVRVFGRHAESVVGTTVPVVGAPRDEPLNPPPPERWRAVSCRPPAGS